MLLGLSRIKGPHEHFEQVYPAEAFAADREDFRVTAPVSLAFEIFKDKSHYRLVGRTQTAIELPCSRCLEGSLVPLEAVFDLLYLPALEAPDDEEVEVVEEDINTAFYRDGVIDLGELVHEQLYLALPMKPLCRDDCKGLCSVCGANRNQTACACNVRWEDPRLAGLKALVKDNDHA